MPITAASALEFFDAFNMAAECAVAAGDLREARHLAERVRDLPFYRSEGPPRDRATDPGQNALGRLQRGGRAGRLFPRGLGESRSAARGQPELRCLRGGDCPWFAGQGQCPRRVAGDRGHVVHARPTTVRDAFQRVLRRITAASPRPARRGAVAAGYAAGAVTFSLQRLVATVVCRALGRDGSARRPPRRRRQDRHGAANDLRQPNCRCDRRTRRGDRRPRRIGRRGRRSGLTRLPLPVGPHACIRRWPGPEPRRGRAGRDGRSPMVWFADSGRTARCTT